MAQYREEVIALGDALPLAGKSLIEQAFEEVDTQRKDINEIEWLLDKVGNKDERNK
jgi:hypothetical protein